jgi:thiamine biosynthesis lipoprotein
LITLRWLIGVLLFVAASAVSCGRGEAPQNQESTSQGSWRLEGSVMGTTWNATGTFRGQLEVAEVLRNINTALNRVDLLMSTYKPDSELSRFNAAPAQVPFVVDPETAFVVDAALALAANTHGAFDPTVMPLVDLWGFGPAGRDVEAPSEEALAQALGTIGWESISVGYPKDGTTLLKKEHAERKLDLSAIAKGYGVDAACAALDELGVPDYLVEVGGELRCKGLSPSGKPWRIGIDAPGDMSRPGESLQTVLEPGNAAVATSGDYRNYRVVDGQRVSHTIDPRSGMPLQHGLASVSVLAPTCMMADALATACMVMGLEEGLALIADTPNTEAMFLEHDGERFQVHYSAEWPREQEAK